MDNICCLSFEKIKRNRTECKEFNVEVINLKCFEFVTLWQYFFLNFGYCFVRQTEQGQMKIISEGIWYILDKDF